MASEILSSLKTVVYHTTIGNGSGILIIRDANIEDLSRGWFSGRGLPTYEPLDDMVLDESLNCVSR